MAKQNIVNFSDFHAHIYQDFAHPDAQFGTDRFREQINVLREVFDYAREFDADILFDGDLFHKRSVVDVRVFNMVFNVFKEYGDICCILVRGNHDSITNSIGSESSLEAFSALPNVTVISTLEKVETAYYTVYGVAYGDETEEMKAWIEEQANSLDESKFNILCAHVGVDGSSTGRYNHTLDGAFKVGDLFPDKFDLVTLGHYHKRQFLAELPNVFYVGNTLQTSFSDEGQDKGFYHIEINGKEYTMKFVKTAYTPFITVTKETLPANMEDYFIQYVGNVDEAKIVKELKEEQNLSNIRVSVQKDYSVKPRIDISAGSTPEEVVSAYTKKHNPALEEKALQCLKQAMEV